MDKDDKKEPLFKRLKNIKDTHLTQLQVNRDQGEKQLKELRNIEESRTLEAINKIRRKNDEAKDLVFKIKKIDTELDTVELFGTKTDGKTKYDLNLFASLLKLARKINNYEINLNEEIDDQENFQILIIRLENYKSRNTQKKKRNIKS